MASPRAWPSDCEVVVTMLSQPAGLLSGARLSDEFWAAAERGELVRPVCDSCGRSFFTPRVVCPYCRSAEWQYRPSTGLGTVHSHTTVYRGPDLTWTTPYVLAVVDMDEGWNLLTTLLVDPPSEDIPGALIDMRVQVSFIPAHPPETRQLPAFAPVPNSAAPRTVDPNVAHSNTADPNSLEK
ncbi:MAG: OB-fold domain-containing protein [Microthrixaceae bacterium]